MTEDAFARRVTKLGSLSDPVRRALYRFVADQPDAVSRDQAADGVEVPRHTARFHLDRLVDEGLLVAEFRRLTGRSGPGAGRPAKLYRRSRKEVIVSVPSRRYDLVGQVLADAVERSLAGTSMADAVEAAADNAAAMVVGATGRPPPDLTGVRDVLGQYGFEPRLDEEGVLALTNCPFDRLAADHRDLVCGMNETFVAGVARHLGCAGLSVVPERRTTGCCVRVVEAWHVTGTDPPSP